MMFVWKPGDPIESWDDFDRACEVVGVTLDDCIAATLSPIAESATVESKRT